MVRSPKAVYLGDWIMTLEKFYCCSRNYWKEKLISVLSKRKGVNVLSIMVLEEGSLNHGVNFRLHLELTFNNQIAVSRKRVKEGVVLISSLVNLSPLSNSYLTLSPTFMDRNSCEIWQLRGKPATEHQQNDIRRWRMTGRQIRTYLAESQRGNWTGKDPNRGLLRIKNMFLHIDIFWHR